MIVNVEVFAPLEQLPSACEALTSITGQSTVELADKVAYKIPPNEPEVDEALYLHVIDESCGTDWWKIKHELFEEE